MKHSKRACELVRQIAKDGLNKGTYGHEDFKFKVYIVACSYILGNEKYWISTDIPDGKYYEVTYNADSEEFYVDCYVRISNTKFEE